MAERSLLWDTNATGDGTDTGYTESEMFQLFRGLFSRTANMGGVSPDYLNELAVTGTSSPVAVNTGAALVYGIPYWNTASVNVTVATPAGATRIDRIVLRADWTAQTVRITHIAGSEGGGAPTLTQTGGTTWDIPLAQASITTGGVITLTDQREWLGGIGDGTVDATKLADGAALAEILDDDGSGSGLDADLLDGNHAAAFAVSAHTHEVDQRADMFSDGEGNATDTTTSSNADGTSTYAARRDHVHGIANGAVTQAKLGTDTLQIAYLPMGDRTTTFGSSSYGTMAIQYGHIKFDKAKLPAGATVKFYTILLPSSTGTSYAQLCNLSGDTAITGSEVSSAVPDLVYLESGDIAANLPSGEISYGVQLKTSDDSSMALVRCGFKVEW